MMQGFLLGGGKIFYAEPSTVGATEQECDDILRGTLDLCRAEVIITNVRSAAAELAAAERGGSA